ncbi:hypothetical protein RHGRI_032675 [Rhododendron griersonianum]|uniref:TF-B3 domain-containing protein n=1 Tax=Rhododendron griersonianum TaxID=479676 RepID=A0AAV6IGJ0_9ERIC|nr:hypothetical protein RHGRI_032675 [Rhododendron griersonianum]
MKQEKVKVVKNKKRLLDLYHKTKKVAFYGYGQPKSVQANPSLMNRVKEVQESLDPKFPIFVKSMNRSAVTVGFMLKLSRPFADLHMPGRDASVVLVDAFDQEEYRTKYLVEKSLFSGGWKAFSISHRLLEGDVLIFQLIKPCEFKVYVVRESELGEVDGAAALMHLKGSDGRQRKSENSTNTNGNHQDNGRHLKYLPPDNVQENSKKDVGLLLEEIITETMNIANAAKASNLLASRIDFASHIEISKAFEQLQASVGSLHTQMDHLDALALKAKDDVESAKERERNSGQVHMGEQKKALVVKLLILIEAKVRLGGEIESLKANTSRLELMCQKEADNTPN